MKYLTMVIFSILLSLQLLACFTNLIPGSWEMFAQIDHPTCVLLRAGDEEVNIEKYIYHNYYLTSEKRCISLAKFICQKEKFNNQLSFKTKLNHYYEKECLFSKK
jgi:hypothetical protein